MNIGIWKLDRLAQSLSDLIGMLDRLREWGVKFHSITEHIDTENACGTSHVAMIGVFAELERSYLQRRRV